MNGRSGTSAAKPKNDPSHRKRSVVVLYNHIGEDSYEHLKGIDPNELDFEPEYPIEVATITEEYDSIVRALKKAGYRARAVNLNDDLRKLERLLRRNRPDVIFNLVEFFHDDSAFEPAVAAVFDLYELAYTGATPFALSLCQDKGLTKQVLEAHSVPTPRFRLLDEPVVPRRLGLKYPLIVKPTWEDASSGVDKQSVVFESEELQPRVTYVYEEFGGPILVEEFIAGRELHVSVWGNDPPEMLPPVEFDFSKLPAEHPHIVSYEAKWDPLAEAYHRIDTVCPARLPKRLLRKVEKAAIKAYEVTECRDYARLDFRLKGNTPYVLEVNPNPDLTEGVSLMESAEVAGYSFSQALARIVEFAAERIIERDTLRPAAEETAEQSSDIPSLERFRETVATGRAREDED